MSTPTPASLAEAYKKARYVDGTSGILDITAVTIDNDFYANTAQLDEAEFKASAQTDGTDQYFSDLSFYAGTGVQLYAGRDRVHGGSTTRTGLSTTETNDDGDKVRKFDLEAFPEVSGTFLDENDQPIGGGKFQTESAAPGFKDASKRRVFKEFVFFNPRPETAGEDPKEEKIDMSTGSISGEVTINKETENPIDTTFYEKTTNPSHESGERKNLPLTPALPIPTDEEEEPSPTPGTTSGPTTPPEPPDILDEINNS